MREYYEKYKPELKKKQSDYRDRKYIDIILTRLKTRALKRNLPFDLEYRDINIPEKCPVFGVPLVIGKNSPYNPSIDRIDSSKGYTKDNIQIISKRANTIKNDSTPEEIRLLYEYTFKS